MREIVKAYDYTDAAGKLVYQNVRFEPKDFRPRRSDGNGGYHWDLKGVRRTLYRLPQLLKASKQDWTFIVEGEADTDRLNALGLVATTSGSSTSWKPEFAKHFNGRLVCILPDSDGPGRRFAVKVAESLHSTAAEVRVLELPGLDAGQDVSDWLNNGGDVSTLLELVDNTETFDPDCNTKLNLVSLDSIDPEPIEWFWPNKIPAGAVTILAGDPGSGKSYLTHYLAAQVTRGAIWTDCPAEPTIKGSVIFFADEDDRSKVIRPRLDANGADAKKVYLLDSVSSGDEREFFDIGKHLSGVERALKTIKDCKLIVLDPVTAYMGTVNANNNAEVRAVLTPLALLAAKYNVTIIGINHLNKRADLSYMYRGLGSQAFVAQSRSAWAVVVDPDDRETRILAPVKSNYCIEPTGLKFRIVDGVVMFESDPWTGHVDDQGKDKTSRVDEAVKWLEEKLSQGERLSSTLFEEAEADGLNKDLCYRAKERLKVRARKDGFGSEGKWFWELPKED